HASATPTLGLGGSRTRSDAPTTPTLRPAAASVGKHHVDQRRPGDACILEHNHSYRATAERAGLTQVWRGHDAGTPDPDAIRLIFADRPLDNERLGSIIAQR